MGADSRTVDLARAPPYPFTVQTQSQLQHCTLPSVPGCFASCQCALAPACPPVLQNHYTPHMLCLIAVVKLICISITVVSGFRGGFIFPLFFSGTALGLAISTVPNIPFISDLPPVMLAMTMAAGQWLPVAATVLGCFFVGAVRQQEGTNSGSIQVLVGSTAALSQVLFWWLSSGAVLPAAMNARVLLQHSLWMVNGPCSP